MKNLMILGALFGAITAAGYSDNSGIFSFKAGQFEIFILVESERDGNAGILTGADSAVLSKYIPAQGFKHSANAILVKTSGQNILIDSGTGAGGIIIEKIKRLGVEPEKINTILITHLHGDHFGSLQRDGKAVFPNAKVYISKKELDYFTVTNPNQGAVNALAPYKSQIVTFEGGDLLNDSKPEILPGIKPIAAYGHTPGHTIYLLESGRAKVLVIGDLLHVGLVQFHLPQISVTYDMDGAEAAKIRQQVLYYAAVNNIPIAGMHIVYPGMGMLQAYNNGQSFNYTPME
ncbi:MAG: MBL fold metallo-hydrolase [Treponema sp.]|nr:MBL fold metallo-hydrolase [Treponema sp.]